AQPRNLGGTARGNHRIDRQTGRLGGGERGRLRPGTPRAPSRAHQGWSGGTAAGTVPRCGWSPVVPTRRRLREGGDRGGSRGRGGGDPARRRRRPRRRPAPAA